MSTPEVKQAVQKLLAEIVGLPPTCSRLTCTLIADHREGGSAARSPGHMLYSLAEQLEPCGLPMKVAQLEVGDFVLAIDDKYADQRTILPIIIERKSAVDLRQSWLPSCAALPGALPGREGGIHRFDRQRARMCAAFPCATFSHVGAAATDTSAIRVLLLDLPGPEESVTARGSDLSSEEANALRLKLDAAAVEDGCHVVPCHNGSTQCNTGGIYDDLLGGLALTLLSIAHVAVRRHSKPMGPQLTLHPPPLKSSSFSSGPLNPHPQTLTLPTADWG
jgi:hypothetical protein